MHQGYVRDAERLNAQLEHYAADSRYQGMYIDLVRNAFYRLSLSPCVTHFLVLLGEICAWLKEDYWL